MKVAGQNAIRITGKMLSATSSLPSLQSIHPLSSSLFKKFQETNSKISSSKSRHEPISFVRITTRSSFGSTTMALRFTIFTILLLIDVNQKLICNAVPSSSVPNIRLREVALKNLAGISSGVANVTRQHEGDVFAANDMPTCDADTCVGLSSGTAGLFVSDTRKPDISPKRFKTESTSDICKCQCLPYLNTYREDLGICVDDIHECALSPFVSGSSSEKIPFVFLPLNGQIIHPSREISFPGVRTPICAVTGSQFLSTHGWSELRNPIDTDFPFQIFRDDGRTFLQWIGEPDLRQKMQGRLILVNLMCRDLSLPATLENETERGTKPNDPNKGIFTPCVAFRVNGSPVKYFNNVSEVLFQSETTENLASTSEGMSTKEYVVIGICSLLLGLIYVASVFLYLHVKKRKNQLTESLASIADLKNEINYPKNDQVTFGAPFARSGSVYSTNQTTASHMDPRNLSRQASMHRVNGVNGVSNNSGNMSVEEVGIIKNNPLLKHYPILSDHSGFTSDLSNSTSEHDDNHSTVAERIRNMQTSVLVHPLSDACKSDLDRNNMFETSASPTQENECLPEENVSIIEDVANDEKLENMRAIVNGTIRKKLYFNPAYFEPQLLMSPPPAAIEFLTKIREVIAIAKYKMATKRYQPSLDLIPEEGHTNDIYGKATSQRSHHYSAVSLRSTETASAKCNNQGCPGCLGRCASRSEETSPPKCGNCGDKRNSIEKWLEGVPVHNNGLNGLQETSVDQPDHQREARSPSRSIKTSNMREWNKIGKHCEDEIMCRQIGSIKVTNDSSNAPKIISHSLKPHAEYACRKEIAGQTHSGRMSPSLFKCDANEIYCQLAKSGSEIYNNPKFNLNGSPHSSQKSTCRSSRKRIEVLDQYANPQCNEKSHYDMLRSIKHMPDMVYEALAKDYTQMKFQSQKTENGLYNIPTPDYDGTLSKSSRNVHNRDPTPDYNSVGRKSLRQYQPDSPIYRRKSPQYLIVDYETDSLERSAAKKLSNTSAPSSDSSSQPSPSLSTALPLEEEVEVHHTVYDKVEGFRKDGDVKIKKKLGPSEYEDVKVSYRKIPPLSPRIKYDTPFRGSMTIEVEHEPASDQDLSTDSDQFEPDTLDRKPKKTCFGSRSNSVSSYSKPIGNAWSEHLQKSKSFVNSHDDRINYSSLENMTSLPDFSQKRHLNHQVGMQPSQSFRRSTESCYSTQSRNDSDDQKLIKQTFGSLREIYQSRAQLQKSKPSGLDFDKEGRLLTLEAKHSKRQRHDIVDHSKKAKPPDVVPPESNYYDIPAKLRSKIDDVITPKNLKSWNSDDFSGGNTKNISTAADPKSKVTNKKTPSSTEETDVGETETTSSNSESTEITGVSDTQANSESEHDKKALLRRNSSSQNHEIGEKYRNDTLKRNSAANNKRALRNGELYSSVKFHNGDNGAQCQHVTERTINDSYSMNPNTSKFLDDMDKIEVLSARSLSNKSVQFQKAGSPCRNSITESESSVVSGRFIPDGLNVQQVYRVEICSPTNGMQIAMGLRDRGRSKKSKDLKNAWKKFVSLAASKFNGGHVSGGNHPHRSTDTLGKKSVLSDSLDRDEGISSLIDEGSKIYDISYPIPIGSGSLGSDQRKSAYMEAKNRFGIARSASSYFDNRYGLYRQDFDSGYISEDSGEYKSYSRRMYERFNFKSIADKNRATGIDTIEDQTETSDASSQKNPTVKTTRGCGSKNCTRNSYIRDKHCTNMSSNNNNICTVNNNNFETNFNQEIQVDVYSSDDEPYTSQTVSSSSEDGGNTEDMCESGAESIETHSVLFKNIRNSQDHHKY